MDCVQNPESHFSWRLGLASASIQNVSGGLTQWTCALLPLASVIFVSQDCRTLARYVHLHVYNIYFYMYCVHRHISTISSLKVAEFSFTAPTRFMNEQPSGSREQRHIPPQPNQPTIGYHPVQTHMLTLPCTRTHAKPPLETGASRGAAGVVRSPRPPS